MKDFSFIYKIDPNIRMLFVPSIFIVVILSLIVFSVNTGYSSVTGRIGQLDNLRKDEEKLSTKLEILRQVEEGLLEYSNASLIAVPDKNPTTWSISLIKSSIFENSLETISAEASIRKSKNEGLSNVNIELELSGTLEGLLRFAESTRNMAPIIKTKNIKMSVDEEVYTGTFELWTHWASLPKKLPAIDEPITSFDEKELSTLVDIKDLIRPDFNILDPQDPSQREDPFR